MQPGTETAAGLVAELRHLLDEDGEHVLEQVSGIVVIEAGAPRPAIEEGCVELNETLPRLPVLGMFQAFEQTDRRGAHGRLDRPLWSAAETAALHRKLTLLSEQLAQDVL